MPVDVDQAINMKCPACKRTLPAAPRMEEATVCIKRSCRCGTRWSVVITPMFTKKDENGELIIATHYVRWTCLVGTPVPTKK